MNGISSPEQFNLSMSKRVLAAVLSLVLVVAFLPSFFFASLGTAYAETQTRISGGSTISTGGTYRIVSDANGCTAGCIKVETTEAVTIIGDGIGSGSDLGVASKYGSSVYFDCVTASPVNLTFKDVFLNGAAGNTIVDIAGEKNVIKFEGTNIIDCDTGTSYPECAVIHVGKGDSLEVGGAGTLYMYKRCAGAGFGGAKAEMNGDITFNMTGKLFLKTTKQGAGIGAGADASSSTEAPGSITFNSGTYNLISNAAGAAIGGAAGSGGGSTGTNVYLNGGNININVDWTGAAIGGGGYSEGNDSSGGKAYFGGASVRVYVDTNVAVNRPTAKYWKGVYLTEGINNTSVTAQRLDSTGKNATYVCAIDTTGIKANASGNYVIQVDNETVYTGGLHSYCYANEHYDKDAGEQVKITTTPSNWVSSVDPCLYLYLTGTDHQIDVNGTKLTATYNKSAEGTLAECNGGSFTLSEDKYSGGRGIANNPYIISTSADLEELAANVNNGVSTQEGIYFKMSADIDLSSISSWSAIGQSGSRPFAGIFDGDGHSIKGLNLVPTGNTGLFGYNKGTIKNITTYGATNGAGTSDNNAIVCGYNDGLVQNCINYGTVTVTSSSAYANGGIVGQNGANGKIYKCANNGNVTAVKVSGGICGRNYGEINQCFNTAEITGTGASKDGLGGIVGLAGDKSSTYKNIITNCYNTGSISNDGGRWYGGIAGMADSASTVTNCYNVGTLATGYSWNWNPIIGSVDGGSKNPTVSNNYTLDTVSSGDKTSTTQPYTIGTKKTAAEMKTAEFAATLGAAYRAASSTEENDGYPVIASDATIIDASAVSMTSGLVYTGKEQTGVVSANENITLSGTPSATDAGTYSVSAELPSNAIWSDGSVGAKSFTWSIAKATLTARYVGETIAANAKPELKVDVTGFVDGEDATNATDYVAPTVTFDQTPVAGQTYSLTPAGGSAKNYDFTYVAGNLVADFSADKEAAKDAIAEYATGAKSDIDSLLNIDEYTKSNYKSQVDAEVERAGIKIDGAASADAIKTAKEAGISAIDEVSSAATEKDAQILEGAKKAAKGDINAKLASNVDTVKVLDCLTSTQVANYVAAMNAAANTAIEAIDKAVKIDEVSSAKDVALASIAATVKSAQETSAKAPYLAGSTFTSGNFEYTVLSDRKTVSVKAVASAKSKLKSVKIASSVKDANGNSYTIVQISGSAFKNCKKLTKVSGGANIVKIGASAFSGCKKLKNFSCTSKVLKTIGSKAFYKTAKLTKVTVNKTTKLKTVTNAFKNAGKNGGKKLVVKVKSSKKKAYKKLILKRGKNKKITVK